MNGNTDPALLLDLDGVTKGLIEHFLACLDYKSPHTPNTDLLRKAVHRRATQMQILIGSDPTSKMQFDTAVSVAAHFYPYHALEIQSHIAMFTWLGFIIDDHEHGLSNHLPLFQQRLMANKQQPSKVLSGFAQVLQEVHHFYDPVVANFIVLSALAFVEANAIESRQEYQNMTAPRCASSWPYYYRDKEGLSETYAYYCFPKGTYADFSLFMPAIPDMAKFINLTNDILSFYKEEKAGETRNYIRKTMHCQDQSIDAVLASTIDEACQSYGRSLSTLQNSPEQLRVWQAYVMGYAAMHVRSRRYKLAEILSEDIYML